MATSNEAQINTKWVEYDSSNDKQNQIGYQDAKNEIFSSMSNFRFIDEHGDLLLGPTKIAKHVGRMADNDVLTGRTRYEQELINNYLELRNEIEKNYADVIYPIMGRQDPDYTNGLKSMNYFVSLLNSLNQLLSDPEQKFLVNKESITLADFGVASALLPMYKFVFTKDFRENFNFEYATQWYLNVVNSESYNKVLKEFEASLLTKDKRSFELLTGTDDQFANELIDGTIATHKNANNTCGSDGEVGTCQRSTTHRTGLHREARTRRAALSVANEPRQRTLFTIEEFQEFVTIDSSIKFNNVYVVDLNLKEYGKSDFDTWDLEGGTFGGCVFDDEIEKLRPRYFEERNCLDLSNPDPEEGVPFKLFRGFMYTTEELQQVDLPIYEWRENQKILGVDDISGHRMSAHDESILTALLNYKATKRTIGVMGGHAIQRNDSVFINIAKLARELALRGFVITTGGGPGAMEAANFGAYMAYVAPNDPNLETFNEAYQLLLSNPDNIEPEYMNSASADEVLKVYGKCDDDEKCLSLGVATWVYGHEPFNRFTRWTAKFFSNAIREDVLLAMLDCGNIFVSGAGGTRQEIWQDQCANSYADETNTFARPMIFYQDFWVNNGMFDTILNIATDECDQRIKDGKACKWSERLYADISDEDIIKIFQDFKTNIVDVFDMYNTSQYKPYDRDYQMSDYYQFMTQTKGKFASRPESWISKARNVKTIINKAVKNKRNTYVGYGDNTISITLDRFKLLILYQMSNFISDYNITLQQIASKTGFVGRERATLLVTKTAQELRDENDEKLVNLKGTYPDDNNVEQYSDKMNGLINDVMQASVQADDLISDMRKMYEIQHKYLGTFVNQVNPKKFFDSQLFSSDANNDLILLSINNSLVSQETLDAIKKETKIMKYLSTISSMLELSRNYEQPLTDDQEIGITVGYSYLKHGSKMANNYKSLGLPGHRSDHQTYIFVTDPGAGHLSLITRNNSLMDGATVHIEFIDRESIKDKDLIEAYRMPSPVYMSFVRLHVGNSAPTSCYIGRPIFEGYGYNNTFDDYYISEYGYVDLYKVDQLKTVHYSAGAASSAFDIGICDAKIAIEKMSYQQSIDFMKGVTANVRRNECKQVLSAAFNIFTPILYVDYKTYENNDKYGGVTSNTQAIVTKNISDPFEVAKLAIEMAKEGGFDKVTWDGASNRVPSLPIIESLGFSNLAKLVHEAHENGLITYISAGMVYDNVPDAVYTGVDGIGIGVSLHYRDEENGNQIGAFNTTSIMACLNKRTEAENSIRGKGAILLAKLDWQYFEGSIESQDDKIRLQLFDAVLNQNTGIIEKIVKEYEKSDNSKCDFSDNEIDRSSSDDACEEEEHDKILSRARRLLCAKNPLLKEKFNNDKKWKQFIGKVTKYYRLGNRAALKNLMKKY